MLSKTELAKQIQEVLTEEGNTIPLRNIKETLDGLALVAEDEIAAGEDFSIPGLVKIAYKYTSPLKKGEKYKKGTTYTGFGGVEVVAEADSKPRKAKIKLTATPAASLKRELPSARDEAAQAAFLKSKAGKNVVARKG